MEITDQEFLSILVTGIVKNPEKVIIQRTEDDMGTLLVVKVQKSDMGLVIGKAGITAQALKHIIKIFGFNHDERISLKIDEPD